MAAKSAPRDLPQRLIETVMSGNAPLHSACRQFQFRAGDAVGLFAWRGQSAKSRDDWNCFAGRLVGALESWRDFCRADARKSPSA